MTMLFVKTVWGNIEGYTKHKVKEACAACEAQTMLGHPTYQDILGIVPSRMIANCPVSLTAVLKANRIFGPNLLL